MTEKSVYRISFGLALALSAILPQYVKAAEHKSSVSLGLVGAQTGVSADSDDGVQGTNLDSKSRWGLGGSVMFDTPMTPFLSLGVGAIYINRVFDVSNDTLGIRREVPTLFVPIELRVWLADLIYAGGGVFGAVRLGDTTDTLRSGDDSLFSFSRDSRERLDYGLTAVAGVGLPMGPSMSLLLEARYLFGLSDSAEDSNYDEQIRDLAFTVGLRFGS